MDSCNTVLSAKAPLRSVRLNKTINWIRDGGTLGLICVKLDQIILNFRH